jgi:lysophospholipase L1-like esterase
MKKFLLLPALIFVVTVFAQPFRKEIDAFKKQDSIAFPAKQQILFVGSSSFTKWTNVQEYFPQYKIINRGFGGSILLDVIRYTDEIITPYKAKQIVIYCGENDIASSDTVTAAMVLQRVEKLFAAIRKKQKKVEIDFVSIKPSPSRAKFRVTVEQSNKLIEAFVTKQHHAKFINVFDAMLNKDGTIMQEIFLQDNLHMNEKGYTIWQKIIEPYLKK